MKIRYSLSAIRLWLCLSLIISTLAGVAIHAYADGHKNKHEGEKGLSGGYVDDPTSVVAPGAYASFSVVSGGKRYYLGVDTTAAKSGTYRVAVYNKPCYATIWQVGPLWSYTGEVLPDKNYQRTVKSVYLEEKYPAGDKFLTIGDDHGTWSDLELTANEAEATLWFTQKDDRATGRYIQGFLYFSYEQASTTIYRYLTYDGLYGFDRVYSSRPAVSQRVSIWGRTTGDQMACYFMPSDMEFEYNANPAGEPKVFTFRMRLELDGDRFRSQYDGAEFYAKEPRVIDNQETLRDSYGVTFDMGWSSTHDTPAKRDTSIAHWPAGDSAMIAILTATPATIDPANNRWQDDMKTIGASPKNIAGVTKDHVDYIHIHMHYGGNTYDDSTRVIRRLYQDRPFTVLNTQSTPQDHAFPYSETAQNTSFTIAANYADGNEVVGLEGTVISRSTGEASTVTIATRPCYRDTVWAPVVVGEDTTGWSVAKVNLLDTLLVSAYLADGETPAIGATTDQWIQSLSLAARNQISVTAKPYFTSTEYRKAMIKYSYTYRHSSAKGDTVRAEGVIMLSQAPQSPSALGELPFYYQRGASGAAPGRFGRQQAPELVYTTYIIPNAPLSLPIHHDLWGYNRWFNYQDGATRDRDISQNWTLTTTPKNGLIPAGEFVALNATGDATSKGRFDMRFTWNNATNAPAIQHKGGDAVLTKGDTLACDISIYRDTTSTGASITSLTSLTEPTLGYRQLFAVRPATEMAERMEDCRRHDGTRDTLQKFTFVAPYGRRYHISPESPYKTTDGQIEEGHLQYVYYYNPNENNNTDENMGKHDGLTLTDGASYHRIGLPARTTGGDPYYHARLMSAAEILAMGSGSTKQVIMVNPRKESGYVLGKVPGDGAYRLYDDGFPSVTDSAKLRKYIEDNILNIPQAGGTYKPHSNYVVTLSKTSSNTIQLINENEGLPLFSYAYVDPLPNYGIKWLAPRFGLTGDQTWEISDFSGCSDDMLISNTNSALLKLHVNYRFLLGIIISRNGYLTACDVTRRNIGPWYAPEYVYEYNLEPNVIDDNGTGYGSASNQGWCFYEIIPPTDLVEHAEHPKWYRKKQNEATWVSEDETSTWTSVVVLPDGTMSATYSTTSDAYVDYKLESEHFNLVKARVYLRDPAKEGPSTSAIITEDSIDNHYSVMASLGLEQIPVPGTTDIVTPPYHLQFNHTQFAFHYPVGSGEHEIPASKRVTGEDRMPAPGEYITTNKFQKEGHRTIEACAGAEHGYMFCYNRSNRPLVFLDFTMDQPACTDQELTLVANFANPSSNAPHVTAKMYGKLTPESDWTLIYTYLTGEMEQNDHWYQVVLPLAQDTINKYKAFRCVGIVSGTDDNSDAFLLFDRMRLLSKDRPLTSYQKRTTCQTNDSIFIISRIDYKSNDIEPGSIICYQYQRWDNTANGGAGGYVPMLASSGTWPGPYTRLDADHTQVYPGYYKVGMTAVESVTDSRFKSSILHADYGTIVVPEHNYNPATSNVTPSPLRKAAIDEIAALYGDDRSAYYNETDRIMPYSEITTAESFNDDFRDYANPHCKFYVNEGTESNPYWVMYLINRVKVGDSDNGTFRIAMNYVSDVTDRPNFSESACSTERIIEVKHAVDALVDEKVLGTTWHNYTRTELEGNAGYDAEFLPANTAHTIDLRFTPPAGYKDGTENRADCRFDVVRAFEFMRDYVNKTPAEQAAADAQWEAIYRCTVGEFQDAMNIFRSEDNDNPNRDVYQWNDVTPESFIWGGISPTKADSAYKLLDRLVHERLFEVGLSTRELYISNNQDLYFYLRPIAGSGTYIVSAHDGTDSVATASICNNPIWLEMHSKASNDSLRFGYDKKFGEAYAVPVIRASAEVANSALPVRVAAISHDDLAHSGIVIGFDSTHVVETNDPAWIPGTSTFRYTQDRIVQERLYSGYYKEGDIIYFRPVDAAHIAALTATDCECLNYDAHGTTYDPNSPRPYGDTEGTNVFIRPAAEVTNGCNKWHMLPSTSDPDPRKHMPGYHVENNFTLHAGYWYKFKTSFFHADQIIPYNTGDNPAGANSAYFILAIAPETAVWTPSYDDRTNYWNDDNNWTAIVNGEPFHEAIARVPLEGTNVIVGRPAIENHLPVVNNDSLGDVTKGDIDWGFKTATCQDILFRPLGQIYGQEYLDYRRAFTDVHFQEGTWRTFTPAIDHVYSGDLYVPADSAADMRSYFAPRTIGSQRRDYPFLFFQSFYNQTVQEAYHCIEEGGELAYRTKSSAQWMQTNILNQPLEPGKTSAIIAWGPTDPAPSPRDIIVRLPKQESAYHYVAMNSEVDPTPITLDRPAFNELHHNLDFDKTDLDGKNYKDYRLTNQTPAKLFWFGNPTMELIDVYQLCLDNAGKLENEGGGTSFVVYELIGESAYAVYVLNPNTVDRHNLFLAPMRAIGINATSAATELTIRLNTSALIPMPGSMRPVQDLPSPAPAYAQRLRSAEEPDYNAVLYVSATGTADGEEYKAYITLTENSSASDAVVGGEDAECIISHNMADFTFHTPLTMYTVCDNKTLMYDSRQNVGRVPLGFAMLDEYTFSNRITLSFATEGHWDRPLYLHDALSGDSIMIMNGMRISVAAPQTDEIRYYINGGNHAPAATEDTNIATGIDNIGGSNDPSTLNSQHSTFIYDLLGRHVMTLGENDLITNVQLPTGVYIIQRGNKTERMVIQ